MAYCLECKREYPDGVVMCRDCRGVLTEGGPREALEAERAAAVAWVRLCSVSSVGEGIMLKGALESQHLHLRLVSHDLPAYAGVRCDWSRRDWGELRVPAPELLEAREILEDFLRAVSRLPIDTETPEDLSSQA